MGKRKIIIRIALAIVIIYGLGVFLFSQKILPNTTLSGNDIKMINRTGLDKTVKEQFSVQTIQINDDVVTDYNPKLIDLGASIDSKKLADDIAANQNPLLWPYQIIFNQDYDLNDYIVVDQGKLNGRLVTDELLLESARTPAKNAKMKFDNDSGIYVIRDEVAGNVLGDEFKTELTNAITSGSKEFDATKYYISAKVVKADLEDDVKTLNDRLGRKVVVEFGDEIFEIPKKEISKFIFINDEGTFDVNNTKLHNYLTKLAGDYNNVKGSGGNRVATVYDIKNAYYQIEVGLLDEDTKKITGKTTESVFNQAANQKSIPSSSTYIEVSIKHQYMWVYNDGKLVIGTPIVSGNQSQGWDTPTGTYSVWNKETNKVLDGASVGFGYQVPVDYWMAIDYTGVGIHDIDWLTSSNAQASRNVYKTNGSHGCINTPNDLMAKVYNNTPLGTPVYVMP